VESPLLGENGFPS